MSKKSLEIFRQEVYVPLEIDLIKQVNSLIKLDRGGQIELRYKIKTVMKIINDVDLLSPKIIKENNKISWVSETGIENENEIVGEHSNKWFNDYFEAETKSFSEAKAKHDIEIMTALEYI